MKKTELKVTNCRNRNNGIVEESEGKSGTDGIRGF